MQGHFTFCNPTKIYFGQGSINNLKKELLNYGKRVLLVYGKGSIKTNGIYDTVMEILKEADKEVYELSGIMPNPTLDKLYEGMAFLQSQPVDLLLAIGGGSVIDYTKALSVSYDCKEDPWEKYFIKKEDPTGKILPVGAILTMTGTGSEFNGGSVITNTKTGMKISRNFDERVFPKFSILDPLYTLSLPHYQMVSGIYDIFNHLCEQYFSGEDDNVSDDLSEALMRSVVRNSLIALKDPEDYTARSNIMWAASLALNTLVSRGKATDWNVHMLGKAIGAMTDATHGMTLSAVSLPYYRMICPYGLAKFKRFALNVFNVKDEGDDETIALNGLKALEDWMKQLGVVMSIKEFGITEDQLDMLADKVLITNAGYKPLNHDDFVTIFKESLNY